MWVPGIPVLIEDALVAINCNDLVMSLVLDGIVGGVGAVMGFVPQMLVLFLLLAILEDVGYMARIAFIMDRIFRRFGLSGKSFVPMLVATGCGVPGIMASRTIEQDRDRKMTIMTTGFIPCGAKMPIAAYSFMIFNLLCAPCFAAIGYMCGFAYVAALIVYQIGGLLTGAVTLNVFTIVALLLLAGLLYLLFRPAAKASEGVGLRSTEAARV